MSSSRIVSQRAPFLPAVLTPPSLTTITLPRGVFAREHGDEPRPAAGELRGHAHGRGAERLERARGGGRVVRAALADPGERVRVPGSVIVRPARLRRGSGTCAPSRATGRARARTVARQARRTPVQVAREPARALGEHLLDVGPGERRRRVAEVADVEPLRPLHELVAVARLVDVEGEVAPALEEVDAASSPSRAARRSSAASRAAAARRGSCSRARRP